MLCFFFSPSFVVDARRANVYILIHFFHIWIYLHFMGVQCYILYRPVSTIEIFSFFFWYCIQKKNFFFSTERNENNPKNETYVMADRWMPTEHSLYYHRICVAVRRNACFVLAFSFTLVAPYNRTDALQITFHRYTHHWFTNENSVFFFAFVSTLHEHVWVYALVSEWVSVWMQATFLLDIWESSDWRGNWMWVK